jgi:phosphatidylserine decarboxylase
VTPPESGVVVVGNVSAIRVDGSAISAEELAAAAAEAAAATEKLPLVTRSLLVCRFSQPS